MRKTSLGKLTFAGLACLAGLLIACLPALLACSADSPGAGAQDRRDRELQPERVMDAIGVGAGMTIGEPGAGRGYFTFKLAARVGEAGRVYANDISASALRYIDSRCEREGIKNITTILGEVEDPLFPPRTMDLVIFVYALHDFERPIEFLVNLKASLKPGAPVVILDQDPAQTGSGHFLRKERLLEIFKAAGYEFLREETFVQRHLLLLFKAVEG